MPRKRNEGSSAFAQVQRQARELLLTIRAEIRNRESELNRLRDEEATLDRLSGGTRAPASKRTTTPRAAGSSGRIDWRAILEELPKQFKAADIREIRNVQSKRPSEIFAAITRWIEAGAVKRKARGVYERA